VPDGIDAPPVGARVIVPLGSRLVTGIVVERSATDELRDVKPIHQIVDADSFVPPDVVALARWTAEYYACGVGDTIPALLPPMARGGPVVKPSVSSTPDRQLNFASCAFPTNATTISA